MKVRWLWLPGVSGLVSADLFDDGGFLNLERIPRGLPAAGISFAAGSLLAAGFPIYRGCGGCDAERATAAGPRPNWGNEKCDGACRTVEVSSFVASGCALFEGHAT